MDFEKFTEYGVKLVGNTLTLSGVGISIVSSIRLTNNLCNAAETVIYNIPKIVNPPPKPSKDGEQVPNQPEPMTWHEMAEFAMEQAWITTKLCLLIGGGVLARKAGAFLISEKGMKMLTDISKA